MKKINVKKKEKNSKLFTFKIIKIIV